jgi:hypothetical protein
MRACNAVFLFSVLFTSAALAQDAEPSDRPGPLRDAYGVTVGDDGLMGAGPGYRVSFTSRGFDFTALPGLGAGWALPFSFALESIGRRSLTGAPLVASSMEPLADGNTVSIARGSVIERYDVRQEGIEQTFRFAEKPAGSGDLVVRGRITTDLALVSSDRDTGLRFGTAGRGGVTYGAVTGIDAAGRKIAGDIRWVDGFVELTLPDAFVDEAAYPVLLDPLVGTAFLIGDGPNADLHPDVAYDATNDVYLVVWESLVASFPFGQYDVLAQRIDASTGSPVGGLILVAATTDTERKPAVANVNGSNRFLVVWQNGEGTSSGSIEARAVNASDGAVSGLLTVYSAFAISRAPDVGGESRFSLLSPPLDALVTWEVESVPIFPPFVTDIRAQRVHVPSTGTPTLAGNMITVAIGGTTADVVRQPAVTKHGGSSGHWLIVWSRTGAADLHPTYVEGRAIDDSGAFLSGVPTIFAPSGTGLNYADDPDCATSDGNHFLVVAESSLLPGLSPALRVRPAWFGLVPGSLALGTALFAYGEPGASESPALDFARDKYLLAWQRTASGSTTSSVRMLALDRDTGAPCGTVSFLEFLLFSTSQTTPAIGAQWSGSSSAGDGALAAWEHSGAIKGRRVEAIGAGGSVFFMGGGCPGGGIGGVSGAAAIGNQAFSVTLTGAAGPPVYLIGGLSASPLNFPCGGCMVVPMLDALIPVTSAPFAAPVPCDLSLLGATFLVQWVVAAPSSCSPTLSLSSALSITIGE